MDAVILQGIGELVPLGALWGTAIGFVILFTATVLAIGLASKSLTVGANGAFLAFAYLATESNIALLQPILYVAIAMIIIGFAFKLWRLEGLDV